MLAAIPIPKALGLAALLAGFTLAENLKPRITSQSLSGCKQRSCWAHEDVLGSVPGFAATAIIAHLLKVPKMTCEFYWISGSPFAWRAHLALEYKDIPYRSHLLKASEGEHEAPEFLRLNPRGRVPVLKDDESVLHESVAILAYLDARYPKPRLFGSNPAETGFIWQRVHEIENYARNPFLRVAIAIMNADITERPDETRELLDLCREQLDWIEGVLSESQWIAGASVSAADFVLYPVLMIFLRATRRPVAEALELAAVPFAKKWPITAQWVAQIEKMKGYNNTYPPHW